MIRVFARKAFGFKNYANKGNATVAEAKAGIPLEDKTKPLEFANLHDWVVNDPMFQWAKQDGDIQVIENVQQEKQTEKNVADEESKGTSGKTDEEGKATDGKGNGGGKPAPTDKDKDNSKDNSKNK